MADVIHVTPEELKNTAEEFRGLGTEVRNITQSMTSLVDGLNSIHEGDVAEAYRSQFHKLDSDIELMYTRITQHVDHLNSIADLFSREITTGVSDSSALPTNPCTM